MRLYFFISYFFILMFNFVFSLLLFLVLFSGIMVVGSVNPIHSVIFLILVFLGVSGLLIMFGLDYLALVFIVIYAGAIAVLFLFVLMLLNVKLIELRDTGLSYMPLGSLVSIIFFVELFLLIYCDFFFHLELQVVELNFFSYLLWFEFLEYFFNIEILGQYLYLVFFFSFFVAGLILFVAMLGAIVLTMQFVVGVKVQFVSIQIERCSLFLY